MALVNPFRARIYSRPDGSDLSALVAPPYDVVSPAKRAELIARDPHNVVLLELPDGPLDPAVPGNRYETGRTTWQAWYAAGTLVDDRSPAVYVVEQSWVQDGKPVRRRGFVAAVKLHPFAEGVVLPHERTLPKALNDRLELTRATAANLSQVFCLFSDPAGATDALFEAVTTGTPMFTATDDDGIVCRQWAVRDPETIDRVTSITGSGELFIADGHHRYTTALAYRDERRAEDAAAGHAPLDPAYDYVMATLVNMDDPELVVLPTHRLARAAGAFDPRAFWEAMAENFVLTEPAGEPTAAPESPDRAAFLVRTADGTTRFARLRDDIDPAQAIAVDHTDAWKRLDVTVLQEMVLRPLFGITPDEPQTLERLSFAKDARDALAVEGADVAFILNATRMEQLRCVALAGETMPQKSTYFYPKMISGLLFRSLA